MKHQLGYLLFLLGLFALPLFLYLAFSPYKADFLPTVVLGVMVLSQYGFYNEKDFRKKMEGPVSDILQRELKRVPSRSEIIKRSSKIIQMRGMSIILVGLLLLMLMILYRQF